MNVREKKFRDYYKEHWNYFVSIKDTININNISINIWPPSYKCILKDGEIRLSDEFCEKYQEACLQNYDLNIKYFERINQEYFEKELKKLLNKNKKLKEVNNLNDYSKKSGVYILVLDKYKQIYIGQTTTDLKERIVRHWKKQPDFDRLLFGKVPNSIIPIDSFGALDTTKIYIEEIKHDGHFWIDDKEEKLVRDMPNEFILNKIGGGIKLNSDLNFLKALNTINKREFN